VVRIIKEAALSCVGNQKQIDTGGADCHSGVDVVPARWGLAPEDVLMAMRG